MFSIFNAQPSRQEWTKYFVNGVESPREAIYETIQDHKFYDGEVNIQRKYYCVQSSVGKRESNESFADFHLDMKKFVKKVGNNSQEYKVLVEKMLHVVDTFYEASHNYNLASSANYRNAIKNCLQFYLEKISDFQSPYNDIVHECTVEYAILHLNMLALSLSESDDEFDMPIVFDDDNDDNDEWDENWSNEKKSLYIQKLLSGMLEQNDQLLEQWCKHDSRKNYQNEIKESLNKFKTILETLQEQLAALDSKSNHSFTAKLFGGWQKSLPLEAPSSSAAPALNR